jgi:hypothetical protein
LLSFCIELFDPQPPDVVFGSIYSVLFSLIVEFFMPQPPAEAVVSEDVYSFLIADDVETSFCVFSSLFYTPHPPD